MTGPVGAVPPVGPDAAAAVREFAEMLATGQPVAASNAMLAWVATADEAERTRYFAATAVTLVATQLRARMDQRPEAYWVLRQETRPRRRDRHVHDTAMCQAVVRIANGEPDTALDLLNAHKFVHGTSGLFWLGVFAVRMLADLLTNTEGKP